MGILYFALIGALLFAMNLTDTQLARIIRDHVAEARAVFPQEFGLHRLQFAPVETEPG
jgi:hypothetical protein